MLENIPEDFEFVSLPNQILRINPNEVDQITVTGFGRVLLENTKSGGYIALNMRREQRYMEYYKGSEEFKEILLEAYRHVVLG